VFAVMVSDLVRQRLNVNQQEQSLATMVFAVMVSDLVRQQTSANNTHYE